MEKWFIICGLSLVALSFTFIISMGPEDGYYKINKPHIFIGFEVFSFFFVYFISRYSVRFTSKQLDSYLTALQHKMGDTEIKLSLQGRRNIFLALFILLAGLALLGLLILRSAG